jgi:hypothetical protein
MPCAPSGSNRNKPNQPPTTHIYNYSGSSFNTPHTFQKIFLRIMSGIKEEIILNRGNYIQRRMIIFTPHSILLVIKLTKMHHA